MNKDTKILLMAVVIILVALVSFNLSDLTGMAGKSDITTLTVSPTMITFGKYEPAKMMTIRVSPGDKGINKRLLLRRVNTGDGMDNQISSETANICRQNTCYEDVTVGYRMGSNLRDGRYYFEAENKITNQKFKSNMFEIRHK